MRGDVSCGTNIIWRDPNFLACDIGRIRIPRGWLDGSGMNDWDVLRRPMTVYRHVFVVGFDRQSFVERAGILFQTALTKMPKSVC